MLLNITGPADIGLFEVNEAAEVVTGHADANANVIFGAVIDESLGEDVRVTVIATGFGGRPRRRRVEPPTAVGAGSPGVGRAALRPASARTTTPTSTSRASCATSGRIERLGDAASVAATLLSRA